MFKKFTSLSLAPITFLLIALADLATSTSTLFHHGEPDCPEELLK